MVLIRKSKQRRQYNEAAQDEQPSRANSIVLSQAQAELNDSRKKRRDLEELLDSSSYNLSLRIDPNFLI